MTRRFFLDADLTQAGLVLAEDEAHHLRNVMRLGAGDEIEVFNGRGQSVVAVVRGVSRREVKLEAKEQPVEDERVPFGTIAAAVPKGDRLKWMIEKLTELNVARFIPLRTEHSVVHPKLGKLERLQATIVTACKQCGRNRLMQIDPLTDFSSACQTEGIVFLADRAVNSAAIGGEHSDPGNDSNSNEEPRVLIGPEGGFSDAERQHAFDGGAKRLSLGTHILRLETAAIAAAATLAGWQQRGRE